MNTLSVISSSSWLGFRPDDASALVTIVGRLSEVNCWAETLTATLSSPGHCAASAQAWRSAHSPRPPMRLVSSAIGMNTAGLIGPRSGWFQRISASNPETMLSSALTTGW
jgi:hypothetical protein